MRYGKLAIHRVVCRRPLRADHRYASAKNQKVPRRIGSHLALFDCIACDKCVAVCPNDANFALEIAEGTFEAPELVVRGGVVQVESAPALTVKRKRQFANYADFCNDCGNCDVFCPEEGGPYKVKPRFFGARATFDADTLDGFLVEKDARGRSVMDARMDGTRHAPLVRGHVGEAQLVVQLLLRHIVGTDMSDDLADDGGLCCLLAASSEQQCSRQRARDCSDAQPAPKHWRYVQQNSSPDLQQDDARTRDYREMMTEDPVDETT